MNYNTMVITKDPENIKDLVKQTTKQLVHKLVRKESDNALSRTTHGKSPLVWAMGATDWPRIVINSPSATQGKVECCFLSSSFMQTLWLIISLRFFFHLPTWLVMRIEKNKWYGIHQCTYYIWVKIHSRRKLSVITLLDNHTLFFSFFFFYK